MRIRKCIVKLSFSWKRTNVRKGMQSRKQRGTLVSGMTLYVSKLNYSHISTHIYMYTNKDTLEDTDRSRTCTHTDRQTDTHTHTHTQNDHTVPNRSFFSSSSNAFCAHTTTPPPHFQLLKLTNLPPPPSLTRSKAAPHSFTISADMWVGRLCWSGGWV